MIVVSGCFDMLHVGHVRFLEAAAELGRLLVSVANDENVRLTKGRKPVIPQEQRLEMVRSLKCVERAEIATGVGEMDFLTSVTPGDTVVMNFDQHRGAKREIVLDRGANYVVLDQRTGPHTKDFRAIPYKLDLTGWLDQPEFNRFYGGIGIVVSLDGREKNYSERSGLATSTRQTIDRIWGYYPGDGRQNAKLAFGADNPPDKSFVSGSVDPLGIFLPGVHILRYRPNTYWPERITPLPHEWLESVIELIETPPKPDIPPQRHRVTPELANLMMQMADRIATAIINESREQLIRNLVGYRELMDEAVPLGRGDLKGGLKFTGSGGGGYSINVVEPGNGNIKVRRP